MEIKKYELSVKHRILMAIWQFCHNLFCYFDLYKKSALAVAGSKEFLNV
jgi:hypothetical protein